MIRVFGGALFCVKGVCFGAGGLRAGVNIQPQEFSLILSRRGCNLSRKLFCTHQGLK